jgi:hypothetical protein
MTGRECEQIALRLIGGERPSDDAALASHVGSCLRCFRVASEIREVPRIAALLRRDEPAEADPGEAFWARFPGVVGAAFERRGGQEAPVAATPVVKGVSIWQRVVGWFRLPIPAAFGGAAVAAALALVLVSRPPRTPPVGEPTVVVEPARPVAASDDDGTSTLLEDDDPWERLEVADLKPMKGVDAELGKSGGEEGELVASPTEELELLDTDDLRAVAQALRGGAI